LCPFSFSCYRIKLNKFCLAFDQKKSGYPIAFLGLIIDAPTATARPVRLLKACALLVDPTALFHFAMAFFALHIFLDVHSKNRFSILFLNESKSSIA
jgi:hypothetical protein